MNLYEAIQNIEYNRSWLIYAKLINGQFNEASDAVYVQYNLGMDRVIDDRHYFTNGERCGDAQENWRGDFYIRDYDEQWNELVKLYEEQGNCNWGGDIKEVEDWAYNCDNARAKKLVEEARDIFYGTVDDSWILMLIDQVNEEMEEAP